LIRFGQNQNLASLKHSISCGYAAQPQFFAMHNSCSRRSDCS